MLRRFATYFHLNETLAAPLSASGIRGAEGLVPRGFLPASCRVKRFFGMAMGQTMGPHSRA
jgi:hypothetical protein